VEEIFALIYGELARSGYQEMAGSGVVVTGGSAELPGVSEIAEQIFNAPARVGYPEGITGIGRHCQQADVRHGSRSCSLWRQSKQEKAEIPNKGCQYFSPCYVKDEKMV